VSRHLIESMNPGGERARQLKKTLKTLEPTSMLGYTLGIFYANVVCRPV